MKIGEIKTYIDFEVILIWQGMKQKRIVKYLKCHIRG